MSFITEGERTGVVPNTVRGKKKKKKINAFQSKKLFILS